MHRTKQRTTVGYFAAFITLGLTTASLGPSLPSLAENTSTLISQISYLFTARSGGYLIGSWLGGRTYDRQEGHNVLVGMLFVIAITLALIPILSNLWVLLFILTIVGFIIAMAAYRIRRRNRRRNTLYAPEEYNEEGEERRIRRSITRTPDANKLRARTRGRGPMLMYDEDE